MVSTSRPKDPLHFADGIPPAPDSVCRDLVGFQEYEAPIAEGSFRGGEPRPSINGGVVGAEWIPLASMMDISVMVIGLTGGWSLRKRWRKMLQGMEGLVLMGC